MTAKEVLDWLYLSQGSALEDDIVSLWKAWPDSDECVYVRPNSALERCGLSAWQNYTLQSAMCTLGCREA